MRFVWALAFLLSGCLTSERPLIESSEYPIPDGTLVQQYRYDGSNYVAQRDGDGKVQQGWITIEDGWYVHRPFSGAVAVFFRLSRIDADDHVVLYRTTDDGRNWKLFYGLVRQKDGYYLAYSFGAKHLEAMLPHGPRGPWQQRGDALAEIKSLRFLKRVLPSMADRGLHVSHVVAFRPVMEDPVRAGEITNISG